ncbi:flagellar biosynthesis anti-sigma factor FlgM [Paenalcaligenes hominis]|uniref:Negative regulator of flagellin synthesis n=1 Tax=Paenalcaligenes hominis TaxID=643674 RepID=A0A1U9K2I5_9BURK|nr:flagellar biosynthesis anti-sigma factor FlgM [Paenalcaligenes hominis]AQS50335.1 flagellar biosynthesis anti-sigma factor FlgM [Paenalcaligenes hominis]AQS52251.1 flagellar biosynthesis anti-sigma factor FlgM [Paenalcaligenes hominis]
MKITPNDYRPTVNDRATTSKSTTQAKTETTQASRSASVDFSPAARQLQQLHSDHNDIDIDRVNALRTALANGTLEIDTSRIADRLIHSARDLLK